MTSRLTIEGRLNLLVGALLVMALAANVAFIVLSAGPRIKAENESMVNLARQAVERALAELQDGPNPQIELARLVERLAGLRHVSVSLESKAPGRPAALSDVDVDEAQRNALARWIGPLIGAAIPPTIIPATIAGTTYGNIVIIARPGDELDEITGTIFDNLAGGAIVALAIFALTTLAVRQALRPIGAVSTALAGLERGNFAVRLSDDVPLEFREITAKVNDLAASLDRAREENSRLAHQLVTLEDNERRELAAELHDEFGPYLFAIRAYATSLLAEADAASQDVAARRTRACRAVLEQVESVQQANRRVLHRLRPPALAEIGLARAIDGLVAGWRDTRPEVAIATSIVVPATSLGPTVELTIYRVVQEGLTNAYRHASPTTIHVCVDASSIGPGRVVVSIADDGLGRAEAAVPGFGLSAMRDRVLALGGTMSIDANEPSGLTLRVELPVRSLAAAGGGVPI